LNIRDTLLAYLDGTLSGAERRKVAQKLASSNRWRNEYDSLRNVRWQLTNEMPLMGSPLDGQLASLLPSIFEEAQPHLNWHWLIRRGILLGSVTLTILVLTIGFVKLTSSAYASVETIGNVPSVTNTPSDADTTLEAKIRYIPDTESELTHSTDNNVRVSLFASPVPMPIATVEPSLVAGGRSVSQ
jgi:hypothetical protein